MDTPNLTTMAKHSFLYSYFHSSYVDDNVLFQLYVFSLSMVLLIFVWTKTFQRSMDPKIPVLKFPYWSVLGTYGLVFPSRRILKEASLSVNNYILQVLHALCILHRGNPIFGVWVVFTPLLVLNTTDSIKELLSSQTLLEKSTFHEFLVPYFGRGLFTRQGSKYRSRRKLINPSFHTDILKDFQITFNEQSMVLVEILKSQCGPIGIDLGRYINLCALDIACETIFGVRLGAQLHRNTEYVQMVHRGSLALMKRVFSPEHWIDFIYNLSPAGRQFNECWKFIHAFSRKILAERKSEILKEMEETVEIQNLEISGIRKRKAFLNLLLDIHLRNQGLTEEEIMEEVDTFIFASHDTVSSSTSWTLYLIGLHADVQTKIHEELFDIFGKDTESVVTTDDLNKMHYLECVIKECQRLYPPAQFTVRQVVKDQKFCGYDVKKGTTLVVPIYALHRDPSVFPDPEKFDPSRFFPENCVGRHAYAFIPFSAGIRRCIGQRFAVMEMKTIIANVLRNFTLHSLEHRDAIILKAEISLFPLSPFKIKVTKRIP